MKKIIWTSLLSTLTLIGCNNEDSVESLFENVELQASIEQTDSRVAFDQNGKFFWTVNDAIGVTTTQSSTAFTKMPMKEGGAGNATATFTAKYMSGTPEGYAVYPYNSGHSMSGSELTYHFPESYTYTIEDNDYFVTGGTGNSFNPPMWSTITDGQVFFNHLGGVLCIKIADLPAGQNQQLKLIASSRITGDFTTDLSATDPVLSTDESTGNNTVTINYSNTTEATRVFYVPVPTGTYSKLTVEFVDDGETVSIPFDNKEVKVRSLKRLIIGTGEVTGGETAITDAEALKAALEEGGEVTISKSIKVTETLNVTKDVTLTLAEGATLTGSNLTNVGVLNVGEGGELTIKGTGTITTSSAYPVKVNGGTLNIEGGNYTATNSTQAVYVLSGTANISGGYFEVDSKYNETEYKDENGNGKYVLNCYDTNYDNNSAAINVTGGTFKNFDPANNVAEGTNTNFVSEGYISYPSADDKWTVVEGTQTIEVASAAALESVLSQGGSVALTGNINGETKEFPWGESYSNLTVEYYAFGINSISGGTLTLDESLTFGLFADEVGTIKDMTITGNSQSVVYLQNKEKQTTISGVTVTATDGSGIYGEFAKGGIVLENCTVTQNGIKGSLGHFETAVAAAQGTNITINSGTYKSSKYAVYCFGSDKSTVTINGGTFEGELKCGGTDEIIINGGTFSVNPSNISGVTVNGTVTENTENNTWTVTASNQ